MRKKYQASIISAALVLAVVGSAAVFTTNYRSIAATTKVADPSPVPSTTGNSNIEGLATPGSPTPLASAVETTQPREPIEPISEGELLDALNGNGDGEWILSYGLMYSWVYTRSDLMDRFGLIVIPDAKNLSNEIKVQLIKVYDVGGVIANEYRDAWYLYWWDSNIYGSDPPSSDINQVLGI
jgi:hypothetical protein